jgi:aspartate ammonia-lyase
VDAARDGLRELNIGATAVGTGLNAGPEYVDLVLANLEQALGLGVREPDSYFRVTQSMGDVVALSGAVRRLSVEAGKIASDLRLLSMGPRAGLAEVAMPAVQPGSSIMPGKVNPSIAEMVNQVCYQVMGCDHTIAAAGEAGQLELNVMMPVIAWNAIHAVAILANALETFRTRAIEGLTADADRARELLDRSTATATALSPYLGYAKTAELAKAAVASGRSIRDLVREQRLLPDEDADRILSVDAMTRPGVAGTS